LYQKYRGPEAGPYNDFCSIDDKIHMADLGEFENAEFADTIRG